MKEHRTPEGVEVGTLPLARGEQWETLPFPTGCSNSLSRRMRKVRKSQETTSGGKWLEESEIFNPNRQHLRRDMTSRQLYFNIKRAVGEGGGEGRIIAIG